MNAPVATARWIVTLCVAALLLVQILGLHHHHHVHLHDDGMAHHGSSLHFGSEVLHAGIPHDGPCADHGEGCDGASHAHLEVDASAVEPYLFKMVLKPLSALALFCMALLLAWPVQRSRTPPRPPASVGRKPPRHYVLGPPSQAPPLTLVTA